MCVCVCVREGGREGGRERERERETAQGIFETINGICCHIPPLYTLQCLNKLDWTFQGGLSLLSAGD